MRTTKYKALSDFCVYTGIPDGMNAEAGKEFFVSLYNNNNYLLQPEDAEDPLLLVPCARFSRLKKEHVLERIDLQEAK